MSNWYSGYIAGFLADQQPHASPKLLLLIVLAMLGGNSSWMSNVVLYPVAFLLTRQEDLMGPQPSPWWELSLIVDSRCICVKCWYQLRSLGQTPRSGIVIGTVGGSFCTYICYNGPTNFNN